MPVELVRPERFLRGERHALPDARRATPAEIERQVALAGASPVIAALLDAVDATLLVLNPQRQVVAWNGPGRSDGTLGMRPGDVLACVNARARGGCGTTRACESCGALGAVLSCERSARPVGSECVISAASGAALELDVRAAPVQVDGERFIVVTLRDVSVARRREALEQIFFHDVLNTASGLRGWAWRLRRPGTDVARASERIDLLSRQLEREIRDHRSFVLAEAGTLVPSPSPVRAEELLQEVAALLCEHPSALDRTLDVGAPPALTLETDRALLGRVLVNMARNALEATPPGGTVRLRCGEEPESGAMRFSVHNPGAMSSEVQARVFQRSFSTKGHGRGLGTYGMKLIGERYLCGEVSFTSTPGGGTTFAIRVPASLPSSGRPPVR